MRILVEIRSENQNVNQAILSGVYSCENENHKIENENA